MPISWTQVAAAVAPTVINSLFGGGASQGYSNQGQQQTAAGQAAADAARFRPIGITTRFGSSNFQMSPQGYLTGASYNLSPELKAYQDRLMGLTERGLGQAEAGEARLRPNVGAAESLFNLGSQYIAQSPEQTAQKYIESQYNLLAPSRERSLAGLRNDQFQKGRLGLSVGATGERPSGGMGLSATNPEMEAYYNALAQQDLQLAQQAEQAGQQRTAFGTGLFSTGNKLLDQYYGGQVGALNPFTTYLGAGSTIESLGQQPLDIGAQLGGRSATAGANVGRSLLESGTLAAQSNLAAARNAPSELLKTGLTGLTQNPQFWSGVGNWWNTPSGTTTTNAFFP